MLEIRDVNISDADDLLNIYKYYILNTAITFEISVPTIDEFKERIEGIKTKYPYICLTEDDKIIGYAYANVFKGREAYRYSVEISIYLDKDSRNKGYGKKLYLELENRLKDMGIKNVYSCISHTSIEDEYLNNKSESFHEHLGFRLIGIFNKCGYKFNRWYDMVWMEKIIGEHK